MLLAIFFIIIFSLIKTEIRFIIKHTIIYYLVLPIIYLIISSLMFFWGYSWTDLIQCKQKKSKTKNKKQKNKWINLTNLSSTNQTYICTYTDNFIHKIIILLILVYLSILIYCFYNLIYYKNRIKTKNW